MADSEEPPFRTNSNGRGNRVGDFTILREIGRGGMGVVYEATQESLRRHVALKILPLAGRMDQRQLHRFRNESLAAAQLNHPNIVPVYSVGEDAGVHYYAMQYIEGQDLAHVIRHARSLVDSKIVRPSGETPRMAGSTVPKPLESCDLELTLSMEGNKEPVSHSSHSSSHSFPTPDFIDMMAARKHWAAARGVFESVVQIGIQAAEALSHAHSLGVVHRDIKPSNLLLDEQGKVWVTDFGLAQVQGAAALTMTGEVIGTLRYMSPEQPLGQRVLVDQRTDIYSLGVTLYELLTLTKAFTGDTPKEIIKQVCFDDPAPIRKLNPQVPEDLETIVVKAMSRNPDDRYQTAQELADDLRRFRSDIPIHARRPTVAQRCRRWVRRNMLLATSMVVAVTVLCLTSMAASGVIWNSWQGEKQERKRAESLLQKSEGLRHTANSLVVGDENPGLSLLLAVEGGKLNPGVDANTAILKALGRNHEIRTFSPRPEFSDTLSVSPDGRRVLTAVSPQRFGQGNFPAIESDLATGQTLRQFDDGTTITSAAYSPDGRFVLTTSSPYVTPGTDPAAEHSEPGADQTAVPVLWNAATGVRKHVLNGARLSVVTGREFSPTADRIVLPCRDHKVRVYLTADASVTATFTGHTATVLSAAFSPDGKRVVTTSLDGTVRVWNAFTNAPLGVHPVTIRPRIEVTAMFAGDSDRLVISSADGTRLVSAATGTQLNQQPWPETASAVSSNGKVLALFRKYGDRVALHELVTFRRIGEISCDGHAYSAGFYPDGRTLVIQGDLSAAVHETESGREICRLVGHTESLNAVAFVPGESQIVTAASDATVRLWELQDGQQRRMLSAEVARSVPGPWTFSEDSTLVAVATDGIYQTELRDGSGNAVPETLPGRVAGRESDSDRIVSLDDHSVMVSSTSTSQVSARVSFHEQRVQDAGAVPETEIVVILLGNGTATLWNPASQVQTPLALPGVRVTEFDAHPANGTVAVAQSDGNCRIVEAVTGIEVSRFRHESELINVAFSNSGARLLTIDRADTLRIWGDETTNPLIIVQRPETAITDARFSADAEFVLTWSALDDAPVQCWKTETGEMVGESPAIQRPSVAIHKSLPFAAVGSVRDGLRLWDLATGEQRLVTQAPSKSPVFADDRLVSVEGRSGFRTSDSHIIGFPGRPEFSRAELVSRSVSGSEDDRRHSLSVEPWGLTTCRASDQILFSFRTHNVLLRRLADNEIITTVGQHAAPIAMTAFYGPLHNVACVSMDGTISLWDATGRMLGRMQEHQHPITHADISADGLRLATVDDSGSGILWDLQSRTRIEELPVCSDRLSELSFSPTGKLLLRAFQVDGILIRDLISRTDKQLKLDAEIRSVQWTADERQLLIVTGEHRQSSTHTRQQKSSSGSDVFLLDVESQQRTTLKVQGDPVLACLRPGGQHAAVVSEDGRVTLCETATGESVATFNPNRRHVYDAAFSPDGVDLLVVHDDELSLWDLEQRREIMRLPNMDQRRFAPVSLQTNSDWHPFSPDGRWLFSATETLQRWPRDPLAEALSQTPRPLTIAEQNQFAVGLSDPQE